MDSSSICGNISFQKKQIQAGATTKSIRMSSYTAVVRFCFDTSKESYTPRRRLISELDLNVNELEYIYGSNGQDPSSI